MPFNSQFSPSSSKTLTAAQLFWCQKQRAQSLLNVHVIWCEQKLHCHLFTRSEGNSRALCSLAAAHDASRGSRQARAPERRGRSPTWRASAQVWAPRLSRELQCSNWPRVAHRTASWSTNWVERRSWPTLRGRHGTRRAQPGRCSTPIFARFSKVKCSG